MGFWENKRVTVTGGKGFLGSYILKKLEKRGCKNIAVADLPEYNLVNIQDIKDMYQEQKPDIVIHLAAVVGGIGANRENPGKFFYENAIMGIQLLHEAYLNKIEKFVAIGTICAYPKFTPVPFKEEDLWNGYPEETNAPYGLAKKMMLVQSQAYRQQYGFNSIFLLPVNLYGPGDNPSTALRTGPSTALRTGFDPESSHVIPALIKKCIDAKRQGKKEILVWGTGRPSREFIYVEDAAEGILLATEKYDKSEPVNIGAGFEITIKQLVNLIVEITCYKGTVVWDTTKPDGQPRRKLDTSRAQKEFQFSAKMDFDEGLKNTIERYKQSYVQ